MRRISSRIGMCAVLMTVALAAQSKPNFAGKWKAVEAPGADAFASTAIAAVQTDKTLAVTATGQMGDIKSTYNLDGTEAQSPIDLNGTTIDRATKAAWDGNKLVLTATSNFNGQAFEIKEVWSLDDGGTLTIETTRPDFQGGGAPVTSKATYKKG